MQEHELWLTALFNDQLAGLGNAVLTAVGQAAQPRPWANFITMQVLVAFIIIVFFAVLKSQLSMENPGKAQHLFELLFTFIKDQAHENVGHGSMKFVPFLGAMFIFVLFCNLIGIIPVFESPTMFAFVPAGLAIASFLYYNIMGVREHGVIKYVGHFFGPVWWLAPLMFPIEIISHLARPMSLTIRLFANMFAGEQVTLVFIGLTGVFGFVFMGLHVFVSFLQAYIFTLMTMIYLGGAVAHDH